MSQLGKLKDIQSRTGTQDNSTVFHTVKDILIGEIQIKDNIRKEYTDIEELQASILEYGLIQPITVYKDGDDDYVVKTGHRRFKAIQALYKKYPDRFNTIRCFITNADNIAVIQLIENVQRVDLSQIDLFNALTALKDNGMTMKEIAEVIGKTEGHVKILFTGVNEIARDGALKNCISYAGVTMRDVVETKGIPNRQDRLDLLEQRGKGEITRNEMRERVKAKKEGNPATKPPIAVQDSPTILSPAITGNPSAALDPLAILGTSDSADTAQTCNDHDNQSSADDNRETPEPRKIHVSVEMRSEQRAVVVLQVNDEDEQTLI